MAAAWRSITSRPSAASLVMRSRSLAFSVSMRLFFVSRSLSCASICPMRDSERLIQTVSADFAPASSARTPLTGFGGAPPPPAESQSARANRTVVRRTENRRSCRFLFFLLSGSTRVFSLSLIARLRRVGFMHRHDEPSARRAARNRRAPERRDAGLETLHVNLVGRVHLVYPRREFVG